MKKAKADRIMWDVGKWVERRAGRGVRKVWKSRETINSRIAARYRRLPGETIRRCEVFYVD